MDTTTLLVIVLLVWLASQTLIPKSSNATKLTTSQAIQKVVSVSPYP